MDLNDQSDNSDNSVTGGNVNVRSNEDPTDQEPRDDSSSTVDNDNSSSSQNTQSDGKTSSNDSVLDGDSGEKTDINPEEDNNGDNAISDDDAPLSEVKKKLTLEDIKGQKPYFKTKSYALFKYKRRHVFKCLECDHTGNSQKDMNTHYRKLHGLLTCATCDNKFNTISVLWKHEYEHSERANKHPCDDCDKSFPFSSMLKSHCKVHLNALEHHCLHCPKSYKSTGDLVKHHSVHSNKSWSCQKAGCSYTCNDPHNLRAHMHSHGNNTRYKCPQCAKGFNYYMQLKHHKLKGCGK